MCSDVGSHDPIGCALRRLDFAQLFEKVDLLWRLDVEPLGGLRATLVEKVHKKVAPIELALLHFCLGAARRLEGVVTLPCTVKAFA